MKYRKLKITTVANLDTKEVKVKFNPNMTTAVFDEEKHQAINTVLAGAMLSLQVLFGALPVLRPATEEEVNAKVYVLKDMKADAALLSMRKEIYNGLAETFKNVLHELFPDVEYINDTQLYQQEQSMTRTPEEHDAFIKELELLTEKIRKGE